MMINKQVNGTAVVQIRKRLNLTRVEFAALLGVSVQAVYQMEKAKRFRPLTAAGVSLMLQAVEQRTRRKKVRHAK